MTLRQDIIDFVANEARVIKDAPGSFVLVTVAAILLIWVGLSWKFDAQIASRDSIIASRDATIKFQEGLIAEYKNRVQLPEAGEDRKLTLEQKRILSREFQLNAAKLKPFVVFAVAEREPKKYAKAFAEIASDHDIPVVQREIPATFAGDVGLFVLVQNVPAPSDEGKNFMDMLTRANLNAHYMQRSVPASPEEAGSAFALYVGKSPW